MEIECMEAETKGFREDIWRVVAQEAGLAKKRTFGNRIMCGLRVSVVAFVMVMAVGFPLSIDQDRRFNGFSGDSLALLTSTETEILKSLRESLSNFNEGRILLSVELPAVSLPDAEERGAAVAADLEHSQEKQPEAANNRGRSARSSYTAHPVVVRLAPSSEESGDGGVSPSAGNEREPTVEEVISLIQVGQRALRTAEPAIRMVK